MSRHKHADKIKPYPIAYVPANRTDISLRVKAYLKQVDADRRAKEKAQAAADEEARTKVRAIETRRVKAK